MYRYSFHQGTYTCFSLAPVLLLNDDKINFSSPLEVKLGDMLNIKCPPNGTSNVWIQV